MHKYYVILEKGHLREIMQMWIFPDVQYTDSSFHVLTQCGTK